ENTPKHEHAKTGFPKPPSAIPVKFAPQPLGVGASSGACFFDYDGDGKPDLLLVSAVESGSLHLLHNSGDGKFDHVSAGKTDFAVCRHDAVHLFHNDGGGKFTDVTKTVGIKPQKSCAGLTFVD